jgi:MscS family membrane protein
MVSWSTTIFGNSLQEYVIFLIVLLLGIALGKIVSWVLQNVIKAFTRKTKTKLDDVFVDICHGPLVLAVFVATFAYAKTLLVFSPGMLLIYGHAIRILITIALAWAITRFFDSMIEHYLVPYTQRTASDLDDMLVPILHSIVKVIIICMAAIMILSDFGFNVTGLVAGLGIGGLAFAFAAKDLIGNIFGGVSVIADKPFKIGDLVKFDNRQGTVKEIGIRTTRLETVEGTTLIIPNAKFTDGIIENISKRKQHRVMLTLTLAYNTDEKKLKLAKRILTDIVKKQKGTKDDCTVFFSALNTHSLDLTLTYFILDLKNIPQIQDEINMQIKEQFEKAHITFAPK